MKQRKWLDECQENVPSELSTFFLLSFLLPPTGNHHAKRTFWSTTLSADVQEYLSGTSCYITDRNEDGEIWDLNRMSGTNNPPYHCSVYLESSNENALSRINSWQTCPSVYESIDHQGCPVAINPERSPGFYNNNNCDSTPPTMNYDIRTMLGSGIFFA